MVPSPDGTDRDVIDAVAERLGPLARHAEPLGPLTTYRVGGPARLFVDIDDEAVLSRVVGAVASTGVSVLVVGKGSNLLVADAGFGGLAMRLGDAFAGVEVDGVTLRAGAAAALPVVARRSVAAGLAGFEWAVGVPGSMGGGVRMNAGGHGSDMAASLCRARLINLRTGVDRNVAVGDLALGYRTSNVGANDLVVSAELRLERGDSAAGERQISEVVAWRRANQPGGQNAGSVFMNPPGDSAGRLIDAAGCKGLRLGTATVSPKHANFFQADAGGSADDIWALMHEVRRRVRAATGVDLRPETRLVGFPRSMAPTSTSTRGRE